MVAIAPGIQTTFYTPSETAKLLKISTKQLFRLRACGRIAATFVGARQVRFSDKAIEEFIARQTTSAAV